MKMRMPQGLLELFFVVDCFPTMVVVVDCLPECSKLLRPAQCACFRFGLPSSHPATACISGLSSLGPTVLSTRETSTRDPANVVLRTSAECVFS